LKDRKGRGRILKRLGNVELGNLGDCEPVGDGVIELREHHGPGYRIYIGQEGTNIVILLCGGDKDSQRYDIQCAKDYWEDYRRRPDA
jgi:putative addiction module killer protein